jgi:hypothetical protein
MTGDNTGAGYAAKNIPTSSDTRKAKAADAAKRGTGAKDTSGNPNPPKVKAADAALSKKRGRSITDIISGNSRQAKYARSNTLPSSISGTVKSPGTVDSESRTSMDTEVEGDVDEPQEVEMLRPTGASLRSNSRACYRIVPIIPDSYRLSHCALKGMR